MKKTITMFAVTAIALLVGASTKAAEPSGGFTIKGPSVETAPGMNGGKAGLTITSVSIGSSGAIPTYNAAGPGYVDLPWFQDVVNAGTNVIATIQMQSLTFTGTPAIVLSVVQNGTVLSTEKVVTSFEVVPNLIFLAYYPMTAPATTGATQLVGQIYDGSNLIATQIYRIYVN